MLLLNRHESLHVFIKKMRNYLFLKRALSLKAALEELEISVEDEELIVEIVPKVYVMGWFFS